MTFYLKPPRGFTSLEKFKICAQSRLRFLFHLSQCSSQKKLQHLIYSCCSIQWSEYLIDGTSLDRLSHFALRLLVCDNEELKTLVIENETKLFQYRYSHQDQRERKKLVHTLYRHAKEILSENSNYNDDNIFFRQLLDISKQMCDKSPHIYVKFQFVTEMVRLREVILENGFAIIQPENYMKLMAELFRSSLFFGFKKIYSSTVYYKMIEDERLLNISNILKTEFKSRYNEMDQRYQKNSLEFLDEESKLFPLCMQHLYSNLKEKHRLKHQSRIQLTLFMKDVGLNVNRAIEFWKDEYSKPGFSTRDCKVIAEVNKWHKSSKKYEYGIKHLYGLKGNQRTYKSHCCKALQQTQLNGNEEGGCPFVYFDEDYLISILKKNGIDEDDLNKINSDRKLQKYQNACFTYMQSKLKLSHHSAFQNPIKDCDSISYESDAINLKHDIEDSDYLSAENNDFLEDLLNRQIQSSICKEHLCCPNSSSSNLKRDRQHLNKPEFIFHSFRKLLHDLKSIDAYKDS